MKLTHIAKELDLTIQRCSRQLSRLNEIDLVTKDPDGFYVIQPYGSHVFMLFPGFQFLKELVEAGKIKSVIDRRARLVKSKPLRRLRILEVGIRVFEEATQ